MRKINKIILHCAATPNGKAFDVADIDSWHAQRGFNRSKEAREDHLNNIKACGYHYVITLDGTIQQGRSHEEVGAHAKGQNTHSIGICIIGTDQFSTEQWAALKTLVSGLLYQYPDSNVHGHYEFNSHKTCPCFNVPEWCHCDMTPFAKNILGASK